MLAIKNFSPLISPLTFTLEGHLNDPYILLLVKSLDIQASAFTTIRSAINPKSTFHNLEIRRTSTKSQRWFKKWKIGQTSVKNASYVSGMCIGGSLLPYPITSIATALAPCSLRNPSVPNLLNISPESYKPHDYQDFKILYSQPIQQTTVNLHV